MLQVCEYLLFFKYLRRCDYAHFSIDLYYVSPRKDPLIIRTLGEYHSLPITTHVQLSNVKVYGVLLVETLHTLASNHLLWWYIINAESAEEKLRGVVAWPDAMIVLLAVIGMLLATYSW